MSESLTPGQLTALRNLSRKQAGVEVDWINIADARALTAPGLGRAHPRGLDDCGGRRHPAADRTETATQAEGGAADDHAATPLLTSRPDPH